MSEKIDKGIMVGVDGELEVVEVEGEVRGLSEEPQIFLGLFRSEAERVTERDVFEGSSNLLLLQEGNYRSEDSQAEAFSMGSPC